MEASTEEMTSQLETATEEMTNQLETATEEMTNQLDARKRAISLNMEEIINQERVYRERDSRSKKRNYVQQRNIEGEKQKFGIVLAQIAPYLVMAAAVVGMTVWMICNGL